jgi:replicative DNA helicase
VDVERSLVSAVVRTQSMQAVVAREIEPHHFIQRQKGSMDPTPLPGEVYNWMVGHYRRYKAVPSLPLTAQRWPRFEFLDSSDPLEAIVEAFIGQVKRRELIEGLRQGAAIADDPSKWADAELHMFAIAADLARAVPSSTVTRLSDSINRLELHRLRQLEGRAPGITLVGPDLDALTYGVQKGELLIWEGFLGGGKSTMSMIQSATEYVERDKTSLVFALEMEGEKMANRWDAAMAGFKYRALKFMEMRDEDYDKWARFAEKAHEARFEKDVLVLDDIFHCTPERIYAEVERWRPDFFIVDTVDEIRAPSYIKSMYEQTRHAVMELKSICRATKRPGLGVAQSGREAEESGATLGNIAGAIDIARKADMVVGLHSTPQMKRANMIELRMLKNRDGEGDGLHYTYFRDPATLTLRPWRSEDGIPTKEAQPA